MQGRMYSAVFESVTVTAVQDLFEIAPAINTLVVLHGVIITQDNSEVSLQLPFTIGRTSASGSGGSTPTARPLDIGTSAFAGTLEANNTSRGTPAVELHRQSENVLNGFLRKPLK